MRVSSFVLVAMLLAGCATTENYKLLLQSWVGSSEGSLIVAWGQPDSTYRMNDGSKSVRYARARSIFIPGQTTTQAITTNTRGTLNSPNGNSANYNGTSTTYVPQTSPGTSIDISCVTDFLINSSGTVINSKFQGDDCRAKGRGQ